MPNNIVEYGSIDYRIPEEPVEDFKDPEIVEKYILTSLMLGCSIGALYSGEFFDSLCILCTLPLVWIRDITETVEDYFDNLNTQPQVNNQFKYRALTLANQLTQLPIPDLDDLDEIDLDDLAEYLDERLSGCSYIEAVAVLQDLNSNIKLKIVNKGPPSEDNKISLVNDTLIVPVKVVDNAWLGYATINTMISSVVDITSKPAEFKYFTEYKVKSD